MGRKHCGKRRNCLLRTISSFHTVFLKDFNCRHVKNWACLGKGKKTTKKIEMVKIYMARFYHIANGTKFFLKDLQTLVTVPFKYAYTCIQLTLAGLGL